MGKVRRTDNVSARLVELGLNNSPKGPGPHQRSRQANILRLAALFFGSPVRHTWMKVNYLIAISDGAEFLVRSVASAFDAHLAHSAATHSRAV